MYMYMYMQIIETIKLEGCAVTAELDCSVELAILKPTQPTALKDGKITMVKMKCKG